MRILAGTKVIEAPPAWRSDVTSAGRHIVIDLGAGDGRYVYESARDNPSDLYIAIDPDADGLSEYAFRAGRKPTRGGVATALFVIAAVESLPAELKGIANTIRINFPWGSLMRGLLEPDAPVLAAVASLGQPGACWELIASYDPAHDTGAFQGDPLPPLDSAYIDSVLLPAYAAAGLPIEEHRRMTADEALAVPSTWGRRLLHARPRDVYLLVGTIAGQ